MAHSTKRAWWLCKEGHSFQMQVVRRAGDRDPGCPYCAGRRVLFGFNDLATVRLDLAAQWHPTMNRRLRPGDAIGDVGQGGLEERRVRPHLEGQGPRPHARQEPELPLLLRPPQARTPDKAGLGRAGVLFSIRIEMGTRGFPFRAREGVWTLQAVWRLGRSHSQEDRM